MSLFVDAPPAAPFAAAWNFSPTPRKDAVETSPESAPAGAPGPSSRRGISGAEGRAAASALRPERSREPGGTSTTPDGIQRLEEDRMKKRVGLEPCETCANRRYQDESGDQSVSFQAPTHIAPEAAASAVRAHEYEHVRNEQAFAQQEGREVVSQSVRLFTAVCPECGRTYVSGGETRTTTASASSGSQNASATPREHPFELVA